MKHHIILIIGAVLLLVFQISTTNAQDNFPPQGTWGIRASLQGDQQDIMVPYRASERVTISPVFGFRAVEDSHTSIRFGAHAQFFRSTGSDFGTYIGRQLLIHIFSPDQADSDTDILLGGVAGGEYFISRSFSLGVEGQLNLFLNGATTFGTRAAVTASYYF